jgi:periplasmic divalent cation tolerance protein
VVTDFIVVLVTTKDRDEAERISQFLLGEKLIACANIVDSVVSCFWWQDKIDRTNESLLVMKTRGDLFNDLVGRVKTLHSYEVPEVIALPIEVVSEDYSAWMSSVLTK